MEIVLSFVLKATLPRARDEQILLCDVAAKAIRDFL